MWVTDVGHTLPWVTDVSHTLQWVNDVGYTLQWVTDVSHTLQWDTDVGHTLQWVTDVGHTLPWVTSGAQAWSGQTQAQPGRRPAAWGEGSRGCLSLSSWPAGSSGLAVCAGTAPVPSWETLVAVSSACRGHPPCAWGSCWWCWGVLVAGGGGCADVVDGGDGTHVLNNCCSRWWWW